MNFNIRVVNNYLQLSRCPHCGMHKPNLNLAATTSWTQGKYYRKRWSIYLCQNCYGGVLTFESDENIVYEFFPKVETVDVNIPEPAKGSLEAAIETIHSPVPSIMVASRAVDEMFIAKDISGDSLYSKINKAVEDGIITKEMKDWADQVRLDANRERHPKKFQKKPTTEDAKQTIRFAKALAEYMFVLPALVKKGLEETKEVTVEDKVTITDTFTVEKKRNE